MRFTMWDHDGGNDFELIGEVEVTVGQLLQIANSEEEPLVEELRLPKKPSSKRGEIKIFVTRLEGENAE